MTKELWTDKDEMFFKMGNMHGEVPRKKKKKKRRVGIELQDEQLSVHPSEVFKTRPTRGNKGKPAIYEDDPIRR